MIIISRTQYYFMTLLAMIGIMDTVFLIFIMSLRRLIRKRRGDTE